jgi:malate dehydrogenase (oxaloacetate-decarboxylating)(NADP+)
VGKKPSQARIVFSGAGASAIACAKLYKDLGVRAENILMADSKGVLHADRADGRNPYKEEFVRDTPCRTLADALRDCDVFVGLSQAGVVTGEMVKTMARNPIIFAMANPDPEITPQEVKAVRSDAIIATGRSDYPNQVNNVLGFPFIFRGALDVRARKINEAMKQAAVYALAELARRGEAVPAVVRRAYPDEQFDFGTEYIIPKPFDPRVLQFVCPAVAQAAMDSGVARKPIDIAEYGVRLQERSTEIAKL